MNIPFGYCQCGCGQKTNLAPYSLKSKAWINGKPLRFIQGHNSKGKNHPSWKGGKQKQGYGYIGILDYSHPRSDKRGRILEQIKIATQALGKSLPAKVLVHHVNENKEDNYTPFNLVICENKSYHQILHRRTKALKECGHANWRRCCFCHQWDDPENLYIHEGHSRIWHRPCRNNNNKQRRENGNY